LGPIHRRHLTADLVTVIGDREYWGRGLATEAIRLGIRIAFDEFGLRKLSGGVYEGNVGSLKAYTRAGWVIEGRLVGHALEDGKARDEILISCFNPKFFTVDNGAHRPLDAGEA
jgi:RimJ/RimL family protein N-acetyltransferase